jgi:hypothetical protein
MRNATQKASVMTLTPKVEAINRSRTKPVIRDSRVSKEMVEADLKRLTLQSVAARFDNVVGATLSC